MHRHGQVIRLKPVSIESYRDYHAHIPPEIPALLRECNIRNYSIYHHHGYLFGYFEYVGADFAADMARLAANPHAQKCWELMKPMQEPLGTRAEDEWWAEMEEVFHAD